MFWLFVSSDEQVLFARLSIGRWRREEAQAAKELSGF